jgi:AhpD family alkylhydroperoxidase
MIKGISIPDNIALMTRYKRKFSLGEMYCAFTKIPRAIVTLVRNKRKKILDKEFVERLQLAVTEVNGCAACSYAHTYMALKQGMSNEEINSFLSGDGKFINQSENKAIMFAQHYADTRAHPEKIAYKSLLSEYGVERTKIIVAAIQIMHAGNIYGIPNSAFLSRLKGKTFTDSTLLYETGMQLAGIVFLPIALFHGVLKAAFVYPDIKFNHSESKVHNQINSDV